LWAGGKIIVDVQLHASFVGVEVATAGVDGVDGVADLALCDAISCISLSRAA
jgi:hypothetical protein